MSIPEPIHYYVTTFFVKPICKKMQSNPELINHLGLPMQIHFLKINPNVLQWLGAPQSSDSFTCAWENLSQKVYGWRFVDGKKWLTNHFLPKNNLKTSFFKQNQGFWRINIIRLTKNQDFSWILFFGINPRFFKIFYKVCQDILNYSTVYQDIQKHSKIFQEIFRFSKVFQDIPTIQ